MIQLVFHFDYSTIVTEPINIRPIHERQLPSISLDEKNRHILFQFFPLNVEEKIHAKQYSRKWKPARFPIQPFLKCSNHKRISIASRFRLQINSSTMSIGGSLQQSVDPHHKQWFETRHIRAPAATQVFSWWRYTNNFYFLFESTNPTSSLTIHRCNAKCISDHTNRLSRPGTFEHQSYLKYSTKAGSYDMIVSFNRFMQTSN